MSTLLLLGDTCLRTAGKCGDDSQHVVRLCWDVQWSLWTEQVVPGRKYRHMTTDFRILQDWITIWLGLETEVRRDWAGDQWQCENADELGRRLWLKPRLLAVHWHQSLSKRLDVFCLGIIFSGVTLTLIMILTLVMTLILNLLMHSVLASLFLVRFWFWVWSWLWLWQWFWICRTWFWFWILWLEILPLSKITCLWLWIKLLRVCKGPVRLLSKFRPWPFCGLESDCLSHTFCIF